VGDFTVARQLAYLAGTSALFAGVAFLTRATRRRLVGAVCSVLAFTAASAPIDGIGARFDLWSYPCWTDPPHPPVIVYLGQALEFVGGLALIGWRVQRAFGARGLGVMCVVTCGLGLVRDYSVATLFPDLLRFGPAPASEIADVVAWAVVLLFALGVTRVIAGPARADALRPRLFAR
jgi:hypothetical protein